MSKRIFFACLSIIFFALSGVVSAVEPDPFALNNNRVSAASFLDDDLPAEEAPGESVPPSKDDMSMPSGALQPDGVQQSGADGAKAVTLEQTPAPASESENMFKNADEMLAEKNKTKEQIEKDVDALYNEGKKYYAIEDYDGAIEIWERTVQNYPTSKKLYDIRYSLANAYEFAKKYENAIDQYQKVLGEKPKADIAIEAQYRLAGCYAKLEKWPYAMEIYRDIIQRGRDKKESLRAYFNMAQIYMRQEKLKRGINIYRNIIKYYPNTQSEIEARFQLASTYAQTSRFKSSVKEYRLITMKYKDTDYAPRAAMHIGDTHKLAGDYKRAKEAYNEVIYKYYKDERYVLQAEERIKSLKYHKEIENKFYDR